MQEYTIPETAKLPANTAKGFILYPYANYLAEFVWPHKFWRPADPEQAKARLTALLAIQERHDGKEPGDKVRLTDKHYGYLLPRVLRQGEDVEPHLVAPLAPYMIAVASAEEVDETGDKPGDEE